MRWPVLALALATVACTAKDGAWPSLARRPIEGPRPSAASAAVTPPVAPASPSATPLPPELGDVPAQLATIDRDATNLGMRIGEQRAVAAGAAAAAKGTRPDGEAWAKAQIELTRLERLGAQLPDAHARLDSLAGKLAVAAAGGADVAVPLRATGAVIGRVEAIAAEYDASYAAASAAATP